MAYWPSRARSSAGAALGFWDKPLGGNGTLIGALANLVVAGIGERNGVPFRFLPFLKVAFPIMLLEVGISMGYVWWRYFIECKVQYEQSDEGPRHHDHGGSHAAA